MTSARRRHPAKLLRIALLATLASCACALAPAVAGAAVDASINFEPSGAPVPTGWTADTGSAFSAATGQGWVRQDSLTTASHVPLDVSPNARDRNVVSDQLLDTFIHMQYPVGGGSATAITTPAAWELQVPNGDYAVTVSVGDAEAIFDSAHRINIEGQIAIDGFAPTAANHFQSATRTVTVADGRLTIDALGGTNTKIDYVRVTSAPTDTTAPAAPSNVTATPGDARVVLAWDANTETDLAGYDVYRGTSLPVSTTGAPLNGATPLTGTTYTDLGLTNGTTYHYVVLAADTSGNRAAAPAVSATPAAAPPPALTDKSINFEPAGAPVPAGWTADTGAPFSAATGQGWVRQDSLTTASHVPLDVSPNARDRNLVSDQLLDTFIHMQYPVGGGSATAVTTPAAWELQVPDGNYTVTVSVGESDAIFNSSNRINIEGQIAIDGFVPTAANHFQSATRTVHVSDGRLTIDALGGTNTKIDYVRVTSATADATPPAAPSGVTATPGDARVTLAWAANTEPDLAGYDVYRGTSLPVATTGTPLNGTSVLTTNSYTDAGALNGTTYYYVVVARDVTGNGGAASAVSATPQAPVAVSRKINFQPAGVTIPAGYSADTGAAFSTTAGQGWVRQDSLSTASHVPLDVSPNARDRNLVSDQRLDTFIHMQYPVGGGSATAVTTAAAWELQVPNGGYTVTVGVGEPDAIDSVHRINIEGQVAISGFVPTNTDRFATTTRTVNVADGRLTIDATGGTNTKIDYVTVVSDTAAQRPSVTTLHPADGATNVMRDAAVTAEVNLPNLGDGIDDATLNANTVRLVRNSDGVAVPANRNTTGGGDAIILQPTGLLDANTRYRIEVTSGLKDISGAAFLPTDGTFTTGTGTSTGGTINAQFQQVAQPTAQGQTFTSVTMGPDGKLYAGTYDGKIYRFPVAADGMLGTPEIITSLQTANGGSRTLLGLAFDPAATASNLILWVSHNEYAASNATDWTGKISRLSGASLQTVQDYVVGLPRSVRDHETNSIAFGPDGALYVTQGSNSSNGAADSSWGLRNEHVLNAAVLRVDRAAITSPPLNVKSESGGTYDPFAAGAPVTVYASGVRNAFDLVWHTNGQLYVPTNGSAAGGSTPATPSSLPAACQKRMDAATNGAYTGPPVPALTNISTAQDDFLFRVQRGGYYGHPNPARCEWVLNGGNPTSAADPSEISQYSVGVAPDRNWRGASYSFGQHFSPDGAIEYRSATFGGALQGKLLVVRYSAGDDIIVLSPGATNPDIQSAQVGIPGLTGFVDPLDLTEDRSNGDLYVTEMGASRITLLRPVQVAGSPTMATSVSRVTFNDVTGSPASAAKPVTVRNTGTAPLSLASLAITGADAGQFRLVSPPALPASVPAGGSVQLQVVFDPTSVGPKRATLTIAGNDSANPQQTVALRGLGTLGLGGASEPSLQWILDTYDIPVNAGDPDPTTSAIPSTPRIGDEVDLQRMVKASAGNVTIEPLAVFGPQGPSSEVTNLGWYPVVGGTRTKLFTVGNPDYQSVDPPVTGSLSFDPGTGAFGMSSIWPFFSNREIFTEDARNTFTGALPHQVRAYPLKAGDGSVVPDSYVVAYEETTSGYDFQDLVYIVRNVRPAPTSSAGQIAVTNRDGVPFPDRLAFNRIGSLTNPPSNGVHDRVVLRISNTGSGPLHINGLALTGPWQLVSPPTLPATIAAAGQLDVTVRFVATSGSTASGTLTIASDDASTPSQAIQLRGYWQSISEGGQEPPLPTVVNSVFGYGTAILNAGQTLARAGRIEAAGEEVLSPYWDRADTSKPVTVRQLDAFHTQGNVATISWYSRGGTALNTIFSHSGVDGQSLLPRLNGSSTAPAAGSFTPAAVFGFKVDTEWSDDAKNDQTADHTNGCPAGPCGHHMRFWPARDRAGTRIADTWIVAMDYSGINYDYNDNVYLVGNMKPDQPGTVLQRLDVGGSGNFMDSLGRVWKPDTGLFSPATAPAEGSGVTPLAIDETIDDPIYQTYRGNVGNVPLAQRILSYALPVGTATSVDLRLHFAERSAGNNAVGRRLFDILGEGRLLVNNFDIFATTGALNRAYVLALDNIPVSDGTLNLDFKTEVDYASIAGIEVFCRTGC